MSSEGALSAARFRGFTLSVSSRREEIDRVCERARELLASTGLSSRHFDADLLLREFMTNAMIHGNGLKPEKSVEVDFRVGPKWIVTRITDEGSGFSWRSKTRKVPEENETSGRGLAIGALYAHRVRYNKAGNQVTIWMSRTKGKESQGL